MNGEIECKRNRDSVKQKQREVEKVRRQRERETETEQEVRRNAVFASGRCPREERKRNHHKRGSSAEELL